MGFVSGLMKAGIAKKVYTEARKPQNQAKIRQLVGQVRGKGGRGKGSGRP